MPDASFDLSAIGGGLPFADAVGELRAAVGTAGSSVVVQAPPGTGKTTVVPAVVANACAGRVLVTQPRRVAVRAGARRLASLDGSPLGARVGFTVRGERELGPDARVEFLTPGLLLRRLVADPALDGVAAVVLDEVHERQLDTDLLLALLIDLRELRDDLTLVVMSATLDAERYRHLLGPEREPRVVTVSAPVHPLEVRWQPATGARLDERGVRRSFLDHVADVAARAHTELITTQPDADALVFLPGVREVDHVVEGLERRAHGVDVLALHGRVSSAAQDRAVGGRRAGDPPRIVVSTALAESSLTVPGVRLVVDAGLSREPRVDRARGMSGLVTVTSAKATGIQRSGRANRQGPGAVVRCFSPATFEGAADHGTPEIGVADLTSAMLTLSVWGTPEGAGLRWLDAPPPAATEAAMAALRGLAAVDREGSVTALGRRLAALPLHPRWGKALIETAALFGVGPASEVVAVAAGDLRPAGGDLPGLLRALRSGRHPQTASWRRDAARLARMVGARADGPAAGGPLAESIARAWPERIARRVEGTTYLLAQGTRAGLPPGSPLVGEPWLAVASVDRASGRDAAGTGAVIRSAAPLEEARAESDPAVSEETVAVFVEGRVRGRRERRLGAIVLASTPISLGREDGAGAVARALKEEGLGLLPFGAEATTLRRRLALLHREIGAPWPAMGDADLLERWQEWLGPELEQLATGVAASSLDLTDAVRRLLPWPEASRLDELAPSGLAVPSGRVVRLTYPEVDATGPVVLEVKLQECFGLAESPRILGRPVLFHLLSPAGRPLAVTDDLASFWAGPYVQVRAEMRGRYPRHPWPEDPWSAVATAATAKRSRR